MGRNACFAKAVKDLEKNRQSEKVRQFEEKIIKLFNLLI